LLVCVQYAASLRAEAAPCAEKLPATFAWKKEYATCACRESGKRALCAFQFRVEGEKVFLFEATVTLTEPKQGRKKQNDLKEIVPVHIENYHNARELELAAINLLKMNPNTKNSEIYAHAIKYYRVAQKSEANSSRKEELGKKIMDAYVRLNKLDVCKSASSANMTQSEIYILALQNTLHQAQTESERNYVNAELADALNPLESYFSNGKMDKIFEEQKSWVLHNFFWILSDRLIAAGFDKSAVNEIIHENHGEIRQRIQEFMQAAYIVHGKQEHPFYGMVIDQDNIMLQSYELLKISKYYGDFEKNVRDTLMHELIHFLQPKHKRIYGDLYSMLVLSEGGAECISNSILQLNGGKVTYHSHDVILSYVLWDTKNSISLQKGFLEFSLIGFLDNNLYGLPDQASMPLHEKLAKFLQAFETEFNALQASCQTGASDNEMALKLLSNGKLRKGLKFLSRASFSTEENVKKVFSDSLKIAVENKK